LARVRYISDFSARTWTQVRPQPSGEVFGRLESGPRLRTPHPPSRWSPTPQSPSRCETSNPRQGKLRNNPIHPTTLQPPRRSPLSTSTRPTPPLRALEKERGRSRTKAPAILDSSNLPSVLSPSYLRPSPKPIEPTYSPCHHHDRTQNRYPARTALLGSQSPRAHGSRLLYRLDSPTRRKTVAVTNPMRSLEKTAARLTPRAPLHYALASPLELLHWASMPDEDLLRGLRGTTATPPTTTCKKPAFLLAQTTRRRMNDAPRPGLHGVHTQLASPSALWKPTTGPSIARVPPHFTIQHDLRRSHVQNTSATCKTPSRTTVRVLAICSMGD